MYSFDENTIVIMFCYFDDRPFHRFQVLSGILERSPEIVDGNVVNLLGGDIDLHGFSPSLGEKEKANYFGVGSNINDHSPVHFTKRFRHLEGSVVPSWCYYRFNFLKLYILSKKEMTTWSGTFISDVHSGTIKLVEEDHITFYFNSGLMSYISLKYTIYSPIEFRSSDGSFLKFVKHSRNKIQGIYRLSTINDTGYFTLCRDKNVCY